MDYGTCAGRAVTCVLHALLDTGMDENQAVAAVVGAGTNFK